MSAEVGAELSEKFKSLTEEELSFYEELGALAASRHAAGERSFGPRAKVGARRVAAAKLQALPSAGESSGHPVGGEAAELVDASSVVPLGPPVQGGRATSSIVEDAKLVLRDARAQATIEHAEQGKMNEKIKEHSKENVPKACGIWSFIGGSKSQDDGSAASSLGREINLEPSPILVMNWQKPAGSVVESVVKHLDSTTVGANAKRWQSLHYEIRYSDCPPLGKVPVEQRRCHDAQRCVCKGEGLVLWRAWEQLRVCLDIAKKEMDGFKSLLKGGDIVVRFTWSPPAQGPSDHAGPASSAGPVAHAEGSAQEEVWLHIGLMYAKPIRPTFLVLQREPGRDEGPYLGVRACKSPASPRSAHWATCWEALGDLLDVNSDDLSIAWYQLCTGSPRRRVLLPPAHQRVRELPISHQEVWKAAKPIKKKQKKTPQGRGLRGRGRGRCAESQRGGGGGQGRKRSAEEMGATDSSSTTTSSSSSSSSGPSSSAENSSANDGDLKIKR